MLPNFDENGFLPEGVWECFVAEFASRFAVFRRSDRRLKLFSQLEIFLEEILKTDWIQEVIIDGSFVTNKDEPNDIDLILALKPDFETAQIPFWLSQRLNVKRLRRIYKFDVFIEIYGTVGYKNKLDFFQDVRDSALRKGVVRLNYND